MKRWTARQRTLGDDVLPMASTMPVNILITFARGELAVE